MKEGSKALKALGLTMAAGQKADSCGMVAIINLCLICDLKTFQFSSNTITAHHQYMVNAMKAHCYIGNTMWAQTIANKNGTELDKLP